MISFISKKLTYVAFLSGLVLGVLIIILNSYLRQSNSPEVTLLAHLLVIVGLGIITGFALKNELKKSYLVALSALLYTYAISIAVTVFTNSLHYGLSLFVTGLLAIGLFYAGNMFFNRLKFSTSIQLIVVTIGYILSFIFCSLLATYILRVIFK